MFGSCFIQLGKIYNYYLYTVPRLVSNKPSTVLYNNYLINLVSNCENFLNTTSTIFKN